jgi:hypothetical protein
VYRKGRGGLLWVKHAAYCTIVSLVSEHTIFAPTPIGTPAGHEWPLGPEFSDAGYRRESRQALTGSSVEDTRGEDYSEFLICRVRQLHLEVVVHFRHVAGAGRSPVDEGLAGLLYSGLNHLASWS